MKNELKNIRHIWTVLCRDSVIDQQTNNLSLNNVLEELKVGKKDLSGKHIIPERGEAIPFNFQVISLWKRLGENTKELLIDGELEVIDPEGKSLVKVPYQIKLEKGKERLRSILNFQGFKITTPGEYIFKTRVKDTSGQNFVEVGEVYLVVKILLQEKK